jgi:hypothetical protein
MNIIVKGSYLIPDTKTPFLSEIFSNLVIRGYLKPEDAGVGLLLLEGKSLVIKSCSTLENRTEDPFLSTKENVLYNTKSPLLKKA